MKTLPGAEHGVAGEGQRPDHEREVIRRVAGRGDSLERAEASALRKDHVGGLHGLRPAARPGTARAAR